MFCCISTCDNPRHTEPKQTYISAALIRRSKIKIVGMRVGTYKVTFSIKDKESQCDEVLNTVKHG